MSGTPKQQQQEQKITVSSIEARRILAVLEDCRTRIEYALLLPTLNDFLEGRENIDPEVQAAHAEFLSHQHAISSMMTADGEPKPGRQIELNDETPLFKDCARDLIRVMMKHSDFFAPLLQQSGNMGGSAVKLTTMMRELNAMMNLTFSTPVESDEKQSRMMNEIAQRKKTNHDFIEQLTQQLATVTRERDQKVRIKEDTLDDIKQQLQQVAANEAALQQDDGVHEEVQTQEESLKQQLTDLKTNLQKQQKENSEEEGKQRRALRKEEENLQQLISQYDTVMTDLSTKISSASTDAEAREKELHELQSEYDEIERQRFPLKHEEEGYIDKTNQANKRNQDQLAAVALLQAAIRKYLRTAPKVTRHKKGGKGGKKGKGKKAKKASVKEDNAPQDAGDIAGNSNDNPDSKQNVDGSGTSSRKDVSDAPTTETKGKKGKAGKKGKGKGKKTKEDAEATPGEGENGENDNATTEASGDQEPNTSEEKAEN